MGSIIGKPGHKWKGRVNITLPSMFKFPNYGKNSFIRHLRGKGVAGYCNFPDIGKLCLMGITVYLVPSWTDLTNFVT
jgi:hypothetical protein